MSCALYTNAPARTHKEPAREKRLGKHTETELPLDTHPHTLMPTPTSRPRPHSHPHPTIITSVLRLAAVFQGPQPAIKALLKLAIQVLLRLYQVATSVLRLTAVFSTASAC